MTHERFTPARILTIAADLRLWLIAMLVWIVETLGEDAPFADHLEAFVRHELRGAERCAKMLAVLLAWSQTRDDDVIGPAQHTRAPRADCGRPSSGARGLTRRLLPGTAGFRPAKSGPAGSRRFQLSGRAARLRQFLDQIDAAATRVLARAERGFSVLGFAVQEELCAAAPTTQQCPARPTACDTS